MFLFRSWVINYLRTSSRHWVYQKEVNWQFYKTFMAIDGIKTHIQHKTVSQQEASHSKFFCNGKTIIQQEKFSAKKIIPLWLKTFPYLSRHFFKKKRSLSSNAILRSCDSFLKIFERTLLEENFDTNVKMRLVFSSSWKRSLKIENNQIKLHQKRLTLSTQDEKARFGVCWKPWKFWSVKLLINQKLNDFSLWKKVYIYIECSKSFLSSHVHTWNVILFKRVKI